jgi:anti-sigma B factor antagonist
MSRTSVVTSLAPASRDAVPPSFICTLSRSSSAVWVHVEGELDIATSPELDRVLREAEVDSVLLVLDLRGLAFMDVSAVHVILAAAGRVRAGAGRLVIARAPAHVDRMFTLTGACEQLSILDLDADQPAVLGIA